MSTRSRRWKQKGNSISPLLLPSRNHQPPLPNLGRILLRQRLNRLRHLRLPTRLHHLLIRRVHPPIPHVVQNIRMEQRRILRHHSYALPQALQRNRIDGLTVDRDGTRGGFIEPVKETEDG